MGGETLLYKGIQTALLRQARPCHSFSDYIFSANASMFFTIFEPMRSPIAILSCSFNNFNLRFLHDVTFNHCDPNLSWKALNLFTSDVSRFKITWEIRMGSVKILRISFSGANSHFAESNHSSNASLYASFSCSKSKISLKVVFASIAEAEKAGEAIRRAEDTLKPPLAAGRKACKKWLSFLVKLVAFIKSFLLFDRFFSKKTRTCTQKISILLHAKAIF